MQSDCAMTVNNSNNSGCSVSVSLSCPPPLSLSLHVCMLLSCQCVRRCCGSCKASCCVRTACSCEGDVVVAPALCAHILYPRMTGVLGPRGPASAMAGCAQAQDCQSHYPTNWHRKRPVWRVVAATSASAPSADASRGCEFIHQGPHGHRPPTVMIASSGIRPPTAVNLNNKYWLVTKLSL